MGLIFDPSTGSFRNDDESLKPVTSSTGEEQSEPDVILDEDLGEPDVILDEKPKRKAPNSITQEQQEKLDSLLAELKGSKKKESTIKSINTKADLKENNVKTLTTQIMTKTVMDGLLSRSNVEWKNILRNECQVYLYGETTYLAKSYNSVNYKIVGEEEAKEIVRNNLYVILTFKYFTKRTDDTDKRVDEIVKSCLVNLQTFLGRARFSYEDDGINGDALPLKVLSNTMVAFANGVFDFKKNDWVFKYELVRIEQTGNTMVLYKDYCIFWYFNFNFDPDAKIYPNADFTWREFTPSEMSFEDFINTFNDITRIDGCKNYCYELFYNMTHNDTDRPDTQNQIHFAEILGYTIIPQKLQNFVMLIGQGRNGKNSIFDGCFSSRVNPKPTSISLDEIETNKFITDDLSRSYHNIFLETKAQPYKDLSVLKNLTGTDTVRIESKGVRGYMGTINQKFIFAGNDQYSIKFGDTTNGLKRRINMFEISYTFDTKFEYMKRSKTYFKTQFSQNLQELKNDRNNTIMYIMLAEYGIKLATKDYTKDFEFTKNDFNEDIYLDFDSDLKDTVNDVLSANNIFKLLQNNNIDDRHRRDAFVDIKDLENGKEIKRVYETQYMASKGVTSKKDWYAWINGSHKELNDNDEYIPVANYYEYFDDNHRTINISTKYILDLVMDKREVYRQKYNNGDSNSAKRFMGDLLKLYGVGLSGKDSNGTYVKLKLHGGSTSEKPYFEIIKG